MTVAELTTAVRDLLNEDSALVWSDAEILRLINDGERDIATKTLCIRHMDALTASAGTRIVSFNGYKMMYLEYTQSTVTPNKGIGLKYIMPSGYGHTPSLEGEPQNWFETGLSTSALKGRVYIEPQPTTTSYALVGYIADYPNAEMAASNASPEIASPFHQLIVLFVAAMCLLKDKRFMEAQMLFSMYMNEMLYARYTLMDIVPDVKAATNFHEFNKVT